MSTLLGLRWLSVAVVAVSAAAMATGCKSGTSAVAPAAAAKVASDTQAAPVGDVVTIASYNIENWRMNFEAAKLEQSKALGDSPAAREALRSLREANDEDNWEVARVILDPGFSPDILMLQEAAGLDDIKAFNQRWLNSAYETVHVFATNSGRGQNLAMMLKPGFKVVEIREQYHQEVDPDPRGRTAGGDEGGPAGAAPKLFARGPGFALIRTPTGREIWVGNTHKKSKSGNSVDVTRWRNRESARSFEILKELRATGKPVVFVGDYNDELGIQQFEAEAGGSSVELVTGPAGSGFTLATAPLEGNAISYQGYFRTRFRSLIDHIAVSDDLLPGIDKVWVVNSPWTEVASDHHPVAARIDLRRTGKPTASSTTAR